jgi:hypothetical protein
MSAHNIGEIALNFMFVRDQVKIYHWATKSYARHKSSDDFVDHLTEKMDKFIEVMSGIEGVRLSVPLGKKSQFVLKNESDTSIVELLESFRDWLSDTLPKLLRKNTDLLNIRDDILSDVNNTLYLFTLK